MKYIIYTLLTIALLINLSSCNLDFTPENTMVDEIVFREDKTAEAALIGAYTRMNACYSGAPTGSNNYANLGIAHLFGEIGTPTLTLSGKNYIAMETAEYTATDRDGYILETWRNIYNAIDYANNIITNVNKYGKYNKIIMKQHIAEAKFIRAFEYMLLLQMFGDGALIGDDNGLGLIMRLSPYDGYNPNQIQARNTVAESYSQIIKDLKEALADLPLNVITTLDGRTRASRTAVFAFLSRVYLYKGSFKNNLDELKMASDYADSVINNTQNFLLSSSSNQYKNLLFPLNPVANEYTSNYSDEVILLSPSYNKQLGYANGISEIYYKKSAFWASEEFIAQYPSGDVRGILADGSGLIFSGSDQNNTSKNTSRKYNNFEGYNNVLYLRLAEIYLTKAEVEARLNGLNQKSIDLLNKIYQRTSQPKPIALKLSDFTSSQALIDRILTERLRELAYEGLTRYDFIRTSRNLKVTSLANNKKILPIPDYEIRISSGVIKQNTGFTN